jgi:uncharacterized protein (DUF58 family)
MTALTAAVLLALGLVSGYVELLMLGGAAAAALFVAAVWRLLRPTLSCRRRIEPTRLREGDEAQSHLTLRNERRLRTPPIAAFETIAGQRIPIAVPSLAGHATVTASQPLRPVRRGRYVIPPLALGHSDPFRLLRTSTRVGNESVLLVHPMRFHVAALPSPGARDVDGSTTAASPQGGVAFHSLRDYQDGDDFRLIHWASTARFGRPIVRHNVIPDETRHCVALDTSADAYEDEEAFDDAVRLAASWCAAAFEGGNPVTLVTSVGDRAEDEPVGRPPGSPVRILDLLTDVNPSAANRGLQDLPRHLPQDRAMPLGLVTGSRSAADLAIVPTLQHRFLSLSLMRVGVPEDADRPALPGVLAVSGRRAAEVAARWNQVSRR